MPPRPLTISTMTNTNTTDNTEREATADEPRPLKTIDDPDKKYGEYKNHTNGNVEGARSTRTKHEFMNINLQSSSSSSEGNRQRSFSSSGVESYKYMEGETETHSTPKLRNGHSRRPRTRLFSFGSSGRRRLPPPHNDTKNNNHRRHRATSAKNTHVHSTNRNTPCAKHVSSADASSILSDNDSIDEDEELIFENLHDNDDISYFTSNSDSDSDNDNHVDIGTDVTVRVNGLKLDPMMKSLLGVEFLPFDRRLTTSSIPNPTVESSYEESFDTLPYYDEDLFGASDEENDDDLLDVRDDDDDVDDDDDDGYIDLDAGGADVANDRRGNRKNRRKNRGLRKLRCKLENTPRRTKRRERRERKRSKNTLKNETIINGVAADINAEMMRIEHDKTQLQTVKKRLRSVQSESKKLVTEAERSANRVTKLSQKISDLERQLDAHFRSLEEERNSVELKMGNLANLNESQQNMEDEAKRLQIQLRLRLDNLMLLHENQQHVSSLPNASMPIPVPMTQLPTHLPTETFVMNNMSDTSSLRSRAGTDCSFMTAFEHSSITPPSRSKSPRASSPSLTNSSNEVLGNHDPKLADVGEEKIGINENDDIADGDIYDEIKQETKSHFDKTQGQSYIRVHDLNLPNSSSSSSSVDEGCCERPDLCCLNNDENNMTLQSLMKYAFNVVTENSDRWTPDGTTKRAMSKRSKSANEWLFAKLDDVFVWYGKFDNGGYKGDTPVLKGRGMVEASARDVFELLFDSSRVKEYNNFSLGREDKHIIKEGIDTCDGNLHGELKLVRSVSSVPLIRKKMELLSILHGRRLVEEKDGFNGYIIVNRSVWENERSAPSSSYTYSPDASSENSEFIRSEMLLGVNLFRELDGENEGKCELTTITHFFTPGTPSFGARQFGMKAAGNFVRDIQNKFK